MKSPIGVNANESAPTHSSALAGGATCAEATANTKARNSAMIAAYTIERTPTKRYPGGNSIFTSKY